MWRTLWTAMTGLLAALACGCATGPLLDNPVLFCPDPSAPAENNPVWVPQGPRAYGEVFEKVLDVQSDYFEIASAHRYDGRVETSPRIAPGLEQPWRPGSPDFDQRLLATL